MNEQWCAHPFLGEKILSNRDENYRRKKNGLYRKHKPWLKIVYTMASKKCKWARTFFVQYI